MTSTSITAAWPMPRIAWVRDCSFSSTPAEPRQQANEDQDRVGCRYGFDLGAERFGAERRAGPAGAAGSDGFAGKLGAQSVSSGSRMVPMAARTSKGIDPCRG